VLVRDGYANFNLRKVAAEVGVRLNTVQYHFENRENLLAAAIKKAMEDWGCAYVRILSQGDRSVDERLRRVQHLGLDFLDEPSTAPLLVECFALAQHDASVREIVQSEYFAYRRLFADLLRELRPDLSADELMAFATVFAAQMEGFVLLLRRDDPHRPSDPHLRRAIDSQCDAFVAALRAYRPERASAKVGTRRPKSKRRFSVQENG
jgi:AcrR family transcriptional regulator